MAAGEVDAGNLQVTMVQVTLVQRDGAVGGYLLKAAAAHGVIRAVYTNHVVIGSHRREIRRAVFTIVGDSPFTCCGLYSCLVAIGIELRDKDTLCILCNAGVLVKLIRCIHGGVFA